MIARPVAALWTVGASGQPAERARSIAFINQTSLAAISATTCFQVYYVVTDLRYYLPLFVVNSFFVLVYGAGVWLNHTARYDAARRCVIGAAYVQLFVVTGFISTGAGVHFFYFALAMAVALIGPGFTSLLAAAAVLFTICHFAFPPGSTSLVIPPAALGIMYAGSTTGTLLLTGLLAYLFRVEIERAEEQLSQANLDLERLAVTDPLTGLANRRSLEAQFTQEWNRLRRHDDPMSLLVIDIDFFKRYNDHYGHLAGDECLRRVAAALADVSRRGGDLVARYGGEEFVIVLPDTNERGAQQVGEVALAAIAALRITHEYSSISSVVTASIGFASGRPSQLQSPEQLFHRADAALYEAKRLGRNRIVGSEPVGACL